MKKRKSGLIIVSSPAEAQPTAFVCTLCKAEFTKGQGGLYERHVVKCSADREEQIHAMSPRTKAPGVFGDVGWDVEHENWVKRNKDALIRDAKKI